MMADSGCAKRAVAVWHRRAGKDSVGVNIMATHAMMSPGLYYYMAPTQKHARKIIWDNIGRDGRRIIDQAFPKVARESTNDQEMRIVMVNGSIVQVVGSDNYDSIVGSNPRGVVFSEWSLAAKPAAWDYIRPILAENSGWALFIYTPRGLNHGYQMARMAERNDAWYYKKLTIEDTGIVTQEQLQMERDAGMSEVKIRQEFYCEFHQDTERQLFQTESVLEAMKRPITFEDKGAACIVGVDCARFGDDRSVIATRIGHDFKTIPLVTFQGKTSTMELANAIQRHANMYRPDKIFIDATGVGGGVFDCCKSLRIPNIMAINFQNSAQDKQKHANIRAEMFARFADWFEEPEACFHDENELLEQLSCIEYDEEFDPHGRLKLKKKGKIKKDTGVSPDEADACALTFAKQVYRKDVMQDRRRRDRGPNGPQRALMD